MKIKLLSALLFFLSMITSFAQDAKDILARSSQKCQSIQNGYIELAQYKKFMSGNDTFTNAFTGYFKKIKDNALFNYKHYHQGEYIGDLIFTGNEFVKTHAYDSTATIMSKELWVDKIIENTQNYAMLSPFTNNKTYPLPYDSDYVDNKHSFKYIGEEVVNNNLCYRIQMNVIYQNTQMKISRNEFNFWIKKEDLIPVQFTVEYDILVGKDTMYQYEKTLLTKYKINNIKDESIFALHAVPSHYKLKDFVPVKRVEPLPKDTVAPDFKGLSLTGKEISLAKLKGKLVLMDFFYKACYPCMQVLPVLQELHEKYKAKGLYIIGIDPFDKNEDDIKSFLAKRGVTYPVLLAPDLANDYRITGCPTTYLIDKNGKIIYVEVGYGSDFKSKLDAIILKNL